MVLFCLCQRHQQCMLMVQVKLAMLGHLHVMSSSCLTFLWLLSWLVGTPAIGDPDTCKLLLHVGQAEA